MKPFYISKLPSGAEYCSRDVLTEIYAPDTDRILNEIQVVDDRWTVEDIDRICETPPRPELAAFFEIEDWHETGETYEVLRSMSLFSLNGVPIDAYIDGVENQVRNIQPSCPDILFRYYVSGEMWDALAKRGLIGLPGAEFVKMRHSSSYSRMGTFWRFLGLNDNRFKIAFTGDVDDLYEFAPSIWELEKLTEDREKPFDLFGCVLFLREEMEYLNSQKNDIQLFVYTDLHGDGIFIQSVSSLNRFGGKELIRGGGNPLPDLVPLICEYLASPPQQRIYHPQSHRWALFQEREPHSGAGPLGFMNEFFPRFLTKTVPMCMLLTEERYGAFLRVLRRYGVDCLIYRLYHQLSVEGHEIVIAHSNDWINPLNWATIEADIDLQRIIR